LRLRRREDQWKRALHAKSKNPDDILKVMGTPEKPKQEYVMIRCLSEKKKKKLKESKTGSKIKGPCSEKERKN
jgi:hypothetical protein